MSRNLPEVVGTLNAGGLFLPFFPAMFDAVVVDVVVECI